MNSFGEHLSTIFVSHSKNDTEAKKVFSTAFAMTNVRGIFMEYETAVGRAADPTSIAMNINDASAVFVILSEAVNHIPHTRDWIASEAGAAYNKDLWIFDPYDQVTQIQVVTPWARHYVAYNTSDAFLRYLERIIQSYDDTGKSTASLIGAGAGAAIGYSVAEEEKGLGAIVGGFGGLILSAILTDKSGIRPPGFGFTCSKCNSSYDIHLGKSSSCFRCPICNTIHPV